MVAPVGGARNGSRGTSHNSIEKSARSLLAVSPKSAQEAIALNKQLNKKATEVTSAAERAMAEKNAVENQYYDAVDKNGGRMAYAQRQEWRKKINQKLDKRDRLLSLADALKAKTKEHARRFQGWYDIIIH